MAITYFVLYSDSDSAPLLSLTAVDLRERCPHQHHERYHSMRRPAAASPPLGRGIRDSGWGSEHVCDRARQLAAGGSGFIGHRIYPEPQTT